MRDARESGGSARAIPDDTLRGRRLRSRAFARQRRASRTAFRPFPKPQLTMILCLSRGASRCARHTRFERLERAPNTSSRATFSTSTRSPWPPISATSPRAKSHSPERRSYSQPRPYPHRRSRARVSSAAFRPSRRPSPRGDAAAPTSTPPNSRTLATLAPPPRAPARPQVSPPRLTQSFHTQTRSLASHPRRTARARTARFRAASPPGRTRPNVPHPSPSTSPPSPPRRAASFAAHLSRTARVAPRALSPSTRLHRPNSAPQTLTLRLD